MLQESILATQQQKTAADQVEGAIQQIRDAADKLATEQTQWAATSERLETLITTLETTLHQDGKGSLCAVTVGYAQVAAGYLGVNGRYRETGGERGQGTRGRRRNIRGISAA